MEAYLLMNIKNQKGISLLEVLLSITLLSIVLLVFWGYFVQSSTNTSRNEHNASAGQLSQEILSKVITSNFEDDLTLDNWQVLYDGDPNAYESTTGDFFLKIGDEVYYPRVTFKEETEITFDVPDHLQLVHVEIESEQNGERVKIFETFGYKERD